MHALFVTKFRERCPYTGLRREVTIPEIHCYQQASIRAAADWVD